MPTLKNRLVVEAAKNLNALFHLEIGLSRGPIPDFEQLFNQTRKQLQDKKREQQLLHEKVSEKKRQLSQVRGQLSESKKLLSRDRKLLLESNRRLSKLQEQSQNKPSKIVPLQERLSTVQEQLQDANRKIRSLQAQLEQDTEINDKQFDTKLYSDIAAILHKIPVDLGGGCSVSKAYVLATLIRDHDLKTTADIGVYRGRSLFPQALAHGRFTGGVVYGVDPWSAEEAREERMEFVDSRQKKELDSFVEKTDWQGIYEEVASLNDSLGYKEHCVLLRQTSAEAISYLKENGVTLDLVHVDGNHDAQRVVEDVELYTGHLRDGGFLVLDDISFKSVQPVYEDLLSRTQLVFERVDDNHANDYAVFQNVPPSPSAEYNRKSWIQKL